MKAFSICAFALAVAMCGWGWTASISHERLQTLKEQLAAAQQNAERWRITATALQGRVDAQGKLAEACLQREATALADAAEREDIMLLAPPAPIPQHQKDTGVSHATRRAAADYLNRGL